MCEGAPLLHVQVYGSAKRRKTTIRRNQQENAPRKLSPQEVRAKVVEEILCTEKEYVQSLEDIVEVGMATTIYALYKVPSMWNVTVICYVHKGRG